ncbi:hypothetical protein ASE22_17190 [Sphingomonas sp. Root720]|nr:hypothetical protein ASE22_17190 [Sphingomonas sp. Root720]
MTVELVVLGVGVVGVASRPAAIPPGRVGTVTSDPAAGAVAGAMLCTAGAAAVGVAGATLVIGAGVTTGGGVTVTGATSCAKDGVEDKARTAAIAVRPGRTGLSAYLMGE